MSSIYIIHANSELGLVSCQLDTLLLANKAAQRLGQLDGLGNLDL